LELKKIIALCVFSLIAGTITSAGATTFDYSYYAEGQSGLFTQHITGSFDGLSVSGDMISNLSNASAYVNGALMFVNGVVSMPYGDLAGYQYPGNPVVSFDGTHNNFEFTGSNGTNVMSATNGYYFEGSQLVENITASSDNSSYQLGVPNSWTVTAEAVAVAVPEPASYALVLAGLGLVGVAVKRRNATQA
jgi:hypothetical protein